MGERLRNAINECVDTLNDASDFYNSNRLAEFQLRIKILLEKIEQYNFNKIEEILT